MPDSSEREKAEAPAQSAIARAAKDPVSRRRFMALAGGGAAVGLSAVLAACGSDSNTVATTTSATTTPPPSNTTSNTAATGTEQFGKGDLGNPQLRADAGVPGDGLLQGRHQEWALQGLRPGDDQECRLQEAQHVAALTAAVKGLGGKPAPEPKTEFPLKSAKSVLELAGTVENLGAAAYLGQAGNIKSPEVLASALAIHSVEGRHAAALNTLLGMPITPDGAFAKPATAKVVLKSVEPFIVS